jgi:hypothetical protein
MVRKYVQASCLHQGKPFQTPRRRFQTKLLLQTISCNQCWRKAASYRQGGRSKGKRRPTSEDCKICSTEQFWYQDIQPNPCTLAHKILLAVELYQGLPSIHGLQLRTTRHSIVLSNLGSNQSPQVIHQLAEQMHVGYNCMCCLFISFTFWPADLHSSSQNIQSIKSKITLIDHDVWTTKGNRQAFLGISVSYISDDWKYHISHLGLKYIAWAHKGKFLAIPFTNIIKKFGLESRISLFACSIDIVQLN